MKLTKQNKMYVLPARALLMITEYSKPLTRPDWRNCKRMTQRILFEDLITLTHNINSIDLNMFDIVLSYMRESAFYNSYMMYKLNALVLDY
uniref:Uncharacterized protein n=1 Tax=viral metagenome TaxID=1070528 RepID=A0A6C0JI98_9ZZZZ